jgi:hypothetical protein
LQGQDPQADLGQALALYDRKGNMVMAERTRRGSWNKWAHAD